MAKKILIGLLEVKEVGNNTNSIWIIDADGSNLKKLTDNASYPRWTITTRLTFISPNTAKIITLIALALTGLLLLFGMVLITRKAVKSVIPKIPKIPKRKTIPKGSFCPQCGKENSPSASFCTGCGQKLRL